jgi:hypothetical protein
MTFPMKVMSFKVVVDCGRDSDEIVCICPMIQRMVINDFKVLD